MYINCDQVIWLQNALTRYANLHHGVLSYYPKIANNYADTAQVSCLLEIMEILSLKVENEAAMHNLLSSVVSKIPRDKMNPSTNQQ